MTNADKAELHDTWLFSMFEGL